MTNGNSKITKSPHTLNLMKMGGNNANMKKSPKSPKINGSKRKLNTDHSSGQNKMTPKKPVNVSPAQNGMTPKKPVNLSPAQNGMTPKPTSHSPAGNLKKQISRSDMKLKYQKLTNAIRETKPLNVSKLLNKEENNLDVKLQPGHSPKGSKPKSEKNESQDKNKMSSPGLNVAKRIHKLTTPNSETKMSIGTELLKKEESGNKSVQSVQSPMGKKLKRKLEDHSPAQMNKKSRIVNKNTTKQSPKKEELTDEEKQEVCKRSIKVENLGPNVDNRRIKEFFSIYGEVDQVIYQSVWAYVTFSAIESAQKAVFANGTFFVGRRIIVSYRGEKEDDRDPKRTVVVEARKRGDNVTDLWNVFECCGRIRHIQLLGDRVRAYIDFENPESVELALKISGEIINGTSIRVRQYFQSAKSEEGEKDTNDDEEEEEAEEETGEQGSSVEDENSDAEDNEEDGSVEMEEEADDDSDNDAVEEDDDDDSDEDLEGESDDGDNDSVELEEEEEEEDDDDDDDDDDGSEEENESLSKPKNFQNHNFPKGNLSNLKTQQALQQRIKQKQPNKRFK